MLTLLSRQEETQALQLAGSQPKSGAKLRKLLEQVKSRVVNAVLHEDRVRERLATVRHRVVAVDYREDKPDRDRKPSRMAETWLTIRTRVESAAARDAMLKMGMAEGWAQSLERLEEQLANVPERTQEEP